MSDKPIPNMEGPICPLPLSHSDTIVMGHGSGGRLTQELVERVFLPAFSSTPQPQNQNDFASLPGQPGRLSVSIDCHIVAPLFFPGGDIGRLAVCGTVNDIAMSGAQPLYLTAGFILEEGLAVSTLQQIVESMHQAAEEAGISIVAGDTKVVEHGKADGVFITTSGVGFIPENLTIGGQYAQPGDVVLVSGSLGDHGIAVLSARGDLGFSADVKSDVAPLNHMIQAIIKAAPRTHVLRDPTRGGLATTLNEISQQSQVNITLDESAIPIHPVVQVASEMLGFDPLYIANEGKVIVIVPPEQADAALDAMRQSAYGEEAVRIGIVNPAPAGRVLLRTVVGGTRILDTMAGEMLPRIC